MKKNKLKFVFIGFLFYGLSFYSFAQNISVEAKIDTSKILVGDWVKLSLKAQHSPELKIYWPEIESSIGKFEVVSRDSLPVISEEGNQTIERITAVISAYDSGYFEIPAIKFMYSTKTDTNNKTDILTNPINLSVSTVSVDTTKEIKDLKEPIDIPFPLWLIILYICLAILLAIIGYILWNKYKNKKKFKLFEKSEPILSPTELAYKELYMLEEKKLWQKGMLKEYYSEVTEIIRKYIHNRYNIDALEMTSGEILNTIINLQADAKIQEVLKNFLDLADYVKFAKFQPVSNENELEIKRAYSFLEATKEKPVVPAPKEEDVTKEEKKD
jgi:hypothetical protein